METEIARICECTPAEQGEDNDGLLISQLVAIRNSRFFFPLLHMVSMFCVKQRQKRDAQRRFSNRTSKKYFDTVFGIAITEGRAMPGIASFTYFCRVGARRNCRKILQSAMTLRKIKSKK